MHLHDEWRKKIVLEMALECRSARVWLLATVSLLYHICSKWIEQQTDNTTTAMTSTVAAAATTMAAPHSIISSSIMNQKSLFKFILLSGSIL